MRRVGQPQVDDDALAGVESSAAIACGALRAGLAPDSPRRALPCDDEVVDAVLHERRGVRPSANSRSAFVSFSVNSSSGVAVAVQVAPSVHRRRRATTVAQTRRSHRRVTSDGRGVPGSHAHRLRNQIVGSTIEPRRLRTAILHGDPDQDVLGRRLRVLDEDVEVAIARRRRPCRAARTPAGRGRAARSRRSARAYGNAACGYL